jgi:uncharacterized protein (TIGR02996 family)
MTDKSARRAAIAANPDDDTVRLVFADLVEESGDTERAEFIRNQVELARMSLNDPARRPLVVKNRRFLCDYVPVWKAELPRIPGITWGDFNRGLIEEVQAGDEDSIVRAADAIFAEPVIQIIRLARFKTADDFAALPHLERVRALRFIGARASSEVLQQLFRSQYLGNVSVLDLHGNRAGDSGVTALSITPLPSLTELWLGENGIENGGGWALAHASFPPRLQCLDLCGNSITDPIVREALTRRFGSRVKL